MTYLYRIFVKFIGGYLLLPFLVTKQRREEGSQLWTSSFSIQNAIPVLWFHAASVGELEALWPVIIALAEKAKGGLKIQFALTVFSSSARARLGQLEQSLLDLGAQVAVCGYSPWEGNWGDALGKVKPKLFITTKYEAWPELWMSLSERSIGLVIISAKKRRSLEISKWICQLFLVPLPKMKLLTASAGDGSGLSQIFKEAEVLQVGEPRWDQVFSRAHQGNSRAKRVLEVLSPSPRPWGVLGQIWPEDLSLWKSVIRQASGTLIIVPHRIEPKYLTPVGNFLNEAGIQYLKSSALKGNEQGVQALLVDEMGFLSELYAGADWAYVGGGFGKGVHSTIEPAIYGVPIGCGPQGVEKFPEIYNLEKRGQLKIIRNEVELAQWMTLNLAPATGAKLSRELWMRQAQQEKGATIRICEIIGSVLP